MNEGALLQIDANLKCSIIRLKVKNLLFGLSEGFFQIQNLKKYENETKKKKINL